MTAKLSSSVLQQRTISCAQLLALYVAGACICHESLAFLMGDNLFFPQDAERRIHRHFITGW